jgi:predicted metal-dependent hydrolase
MKQLIDTAGKYIIERKKVKHARVTVHHDCRVRITIPLRYTDSDLLLFLSEKANWINKHVSFFSKDREKYLALENGEISFLGEAVNPGFDITNKKSLEVWYRNHAMEYLMKRLARLAAEFGYSYNRVSVRGAKTRWGSCSMKKNISLNWRLMKAPPWIIDYVILHELAHTKIFDHSKAFWSQLATTCPDYQEARTWLKRFGKFLYWD